MHKTLLGLVLFPILIVFMLIVGLSCGSNPPFAPFGSTVKIEDPPQSITIPQNARAVERVRAIVETTDSEGNTVPLNSVRVTFELSFAAKNDLVIDTNGDGIPDSPALLLIDPDKCGSTPCEDVPLPELSAMGAIFNSPLTKLTDDRGEASVIILIFGEFPVNPATLEAALGNGSVDTAQFSVSISQ
ncbi:MAG: hypothetical protein C4291_03425 [Candidatus Dadabacteria bacterium]